MGLTIGAYADKPEQNECGNNGNNCGGLGGSASQLQGQLQGQNQGQLQGQAQGQGQIGINQSENTNHNAAVAGAIAGSAAISGSASESTSGVESSISNSVAEGAVQSTTTSEGGAVESSNSATSDSGGNSVSNNEDYDFPSLAPSSVLASECQTGAAAQVAGGGFNVVNSEQFCDYLKLANAMKVAAAYEKELGNLDKSAEYTALYQQALANANDLVTDSKFTGFINRIGGQLVIPSALIAGLILLL